MRFLLLFPGLVVFTTLARADAQEWRLGAAGSAGVVTAAVDDTSSTGFGVGGRLRLSRGITNNLDVEASVSGLRGQAFRFDSVEVGGQSGDLFADVLSFELAAGARWAFGVETWRALERTHPILSVRGGAVAQLLSRQVLINDRAMELDEPGAELRLRPFVAVAAGVEHRVGDHLFIGGTLDAGVGIDHRHLAANVEFSWSWY